MPEHLMGRSARSSAGPRRARHTSAIALSGAHGLRRGAHFHRRRSSSGPNLGQCALRVLAVAGVPLHAAGTWSVRAARWNIAAANVDEAR